MTSTDNGAFENRVRKFVKHYISMLDYRKLI